MLGIWVVNADGSHLQHVARGRSAAAWSPDGTKIAFMRDNHVYAVRATGGRPKNLTPGFYGRDPAWSPDGHRIVFCGSLSVDLYVMKADGSDPHLLAGTTISSAEIEPDWSPDGRWIVFKRQGVHFGIGLIHPNGKGLHRITFRGRDGSPSWQPR